MTTRYPVHMMMTLDDDVAPFSIFPVSPDARPALEMLYDLIEEYRDDTGYPAGPGSEVARQRVADIADAAAEALESAEFAYTWRPNHDPQLGDRLRDWYDTERPRIVGVYRSEARQLRAYRG